MARSTRQMQRASAIMSEDAGGAGEKNGITLVGERPEDTVRCGT
jgi:hypothetical protein